MKPIITTLVIGNDYRKALAKCLISKVEYAKQHSYTYIQAGEEVWDRHRPISWSKIPFLLDLCSKHPDGTIIWQSDADVLITNPSLTIEEHILPELPPNKDMLLTFDSCGHINFGNVILRNSPWLRDFLKRVGEQKQFTYHIWWENAAVIHLYESNRGDKDKIHITKKHTLFNAYLRGLAGEPLWEKGDFLVHFAGVYDPAQMAKLTDEILSGKVPRISM